MRSPGRVISRPRARDPYRSRRRAGLERSRHAPRRGASLLRRRAPLARLSRRRRARRVAYLPAEATASAQNVSPASSAGVLPCSFRREASPPERRRRRATLRWRLAAASCSGVSPFQPRALTEAPARSRRRATRVHPRFAASWRAVHPGNIHSNQHPFC